MEGEANRRARLCSGLCQSRAPSPHLLVTESVSPWLRRLGKRAVIVARPSMPRPHETVERVPPISMRVPNCGEPTPTLKWRTKDRQILSISSVD